MSDAASMPEMRGETAAASSAWSGPNERTLAARSVTGLPAAAVEALSSKVLL